MNEDQIKKLVKKEIAEALRKNEARITNQSQIVSEVIKNRHIEGEIIKFGLSSARPTDGGKVRIKAWFSTNNDTLSLWNGVAWVDEVLT